MTRKTSSSKSRPTSSKTSTGKKATNSRGQSKATKSSSRKSKTQQNLEKNLEKLTSQKQTKKTGTTSGTKAKAKAKNSDSIKYTRSRDMKLFPHVNMFPWRLEDRKEKKTCWFQCYDHAEKYILRYQLTKLQYKLQEAAV